MILYFSVFNYFNDFHDNCNESSFYLSNILFINPTSISGKIFSSIRLLFSKNSFRQSNLYSINAETHAMASHLRR